MLSNEKIEKFRALYKNILGKEISREEAYEKGRRLVHIIELACRSIKKNGNICYHKNKRRD